MEVFLTDDENQTIIDAATGRVIYFGFQDFMNRIVKGANCFLCGASPATKQFNNEHIIPDWILRRFDLYNDEITLPNETTIKYGQYKIRCCRSCNTGLGRILEAPVSGYLNDTYEGLAGKIDKDPRIVDRLFIWMSLIYTKTHLKNTTLLLQRDKRVDAGKIGDTFDWRHIHHVHCMARVNYSGAWVDPKVFGSLLILPVLATDNDKPFDYMDNVMAQCAMICVGEICIISGLNDSRACEILLRDWLKKITGPLTSFQIREIYSHLVFINLHLKERPVYHSSVGELGYEIGVDLPEKVELAGREEWVVTVGELMERYIGPLVPAETPARDEILLSIKEGKRRYLLNDKGEFVDYSQITGEGD